MYILLLIFLKYDRMCIFLLICLRHERVYIFLLICLRYERAYIFVMSGIRQFLMETFCPCCIYDRNRHLKKKEVPRSSCLRTCHAGTHENEMFKHVIGKLLIDSCNFHHLFLANPLTQISFSHQNLFVVCRRRHRNFFSKFFSRTNGPSSTKLTWHTTFLRKGLSKNLKGNQGKYML